MFRSSGLLASKYFLTIWFFNLLIIIVHNKGYSETEVVPDYCASDLLQIYPCIGFRCVISGA